MAALEDKARQRYQGSEGQKYQRNKRAIPDRAFAWVARWRARKIAPWVQPNDVVLEYGVGLGWNLAALSCARKIGFDVGAFLESAVRKRGIEFLSSLDSLGPRSVDVVICHHALEHIWHPAQALAAIHQLLKPQGRLLLFVPYEKERRFRQFRPADPNHHLYAWNVQTLGNLVSDAGFQVQSAGLGRFGQERFAASWAVRLKLGESGFRALRWAANSVRQEREVRVLARRMTEPQADLPIANLGSEF